jgi:DNA-binding beta-propeller fold protein YncE
MKTAALIALMLIACACEALREEAGDVPDLGGGGVHLVIGGGLSETLDVVTAEDGALDVAADVAPTGSAINQTTARGDALYAVCSLSHSAVVYDAATLAVRREVSLGVGNNPMALAFVSDGEAYVANYATNSVTLYDLTAGKGDGERLEATIAMPAGGDLPRDGDAATWARPSGIAAVGARVYVALSNLKGTHLAGGPGLVAVIDADARALTRTIEVAGRDTVGLTVDAETGSLWAVSAGTYEPGSGFTGDGLAERIDLATETVAGAVAVDGAPTEMVVCPGRVAFLGNAREAVILSLDPDTGEALPAIDVRDDGDPRGLSFVSALACDAAGVLYATDFNHDALYAIDTTDGNRVLARVTVNDGPDTLTILP